MIKPKTNKSMFDIGRKTKETYQILHVMPEVGFSKYKTTAFLAAKPKKASYTDYTGTAYTGVFGELGRYATRSSHRTTSRHGRLVHTVDGAEKCSGHDCLLDYSMHLGSATMSLSRGQCKMFS